MATAARRRVLDLTPLRYAMLRSGPVYDRAADAERRLDATRIVAPAETVRDDGTLVLVRTGDGRAVRAAWVPDSRPRPPARAGRTTWLQHFRGWWLEATTGVRLDACGADGLPYPAAAQGRLLRVRAAGQRPLRPGRVHEFSPDLLTDAGYDAALAGYRDLLGLDPARLRVREVENGVIPMTDAPFPARPSPAWSGSVRRVARPAPPPASPSPPCTARPTSRGARPRRGSRAGARAGVPAPAPLDGRGGAACPAQPGRPCRGPEFFDRLFDRNPAERVLRFLDGGTTPAEEVAIMNSTRLLPMIAATAGDAVHRVRDRLRPTRPAPAIPPAVVGDAPGSTLTARRGGPPSGEDDVRAR